MNGKDHPRRARPGHRPVPVSQGSPRSTTLDAGPFRVTEAWFPPGLALEPHVHDRACFGVMLEGSFEVRFSARRYACAARSAFTEPLAEKHGNRVAGGGARVLVAQPDPGHGNLLRPFHALLDRVNHLSHPAVTTLAHRIVGEIRHPDPVTSLAVEGYVLEMLALAARSGRPSRGRAPSWMRRAREMVHDRFLRRITTRDLADEVGVHPASLARAFRAHQGMSVGHYVRGLRLDWAASRLLEGAESIADIALDAGFTDQSHFTRAFRRHTGLPPGRYRKEGRR